MGSRKGVCGPANGMSIETEQRKMIKENKKLQKEETKKGGSSLMTEEERK